MSVIGWILSISCFCVFAACIYSLYTLYSAVQTQTDLLVRNNQCLDSDINGNPIFANNQGPYDDRLCIFNSLLVSDKEFRNNTLSLYPPKNITNAIQNLSNGTWTWPSTKLIQQDSILSNMILNPWFTADDALNSHTKVTYSKSLNLFIIDGVSYNNFDNSGLNLSSYIDKDRNTNYYLFLDNNVVIQLPIQLFIYNLNKNKQPSSQIIKVNGVFKTLNITPIQITTVDDLKTILNDQFYSFRNASSNTCLGLNLDAQKTNDNTCKFFTADSVGGIVTALKRVVVVPMQNDAVVADFIMYVENKIATSIKLTLLEFFLWLAMKSHRDNITYDFVLDKTL
jgi:hypothetical protein